MTDNPQPGAHVAVVDDDPALRDTLTMLFETSGYRVTTLDSVEALLANAEALGASCLVLDHTLPGKQGIDALETLRERGPLPAIIVLTGFGTIPLAVRAVRSGAFEFLEKPVEPHILLDVVSRAVRHSQARGEEAAAEAEARGKLAGLTPREREVLTHMLGGAPSKAIAAKLDISPRTVEIHRGRVMDKLDCRGPVELFRRYANLITEEA
jgi:two-component system, LuxR family, response regulator FixJ